MSGRVWSARSVTGRATSGMQGRAKGGRLTGEEFVTQCWKCMEVRQHIVDLARVRGNHDPAVQEDYIQEAWLAISTVPSCLGVEGCRCLVEKVVRSSWWQENKERLLQRNPGEIGDGSDPEGWEGERMETAESGPSKGSGAPRRVISEAVVSQILEVLVPQLGRMGFKR